MADIEHGDAVQDAWDTLGDEFVVSMKVRPQDRAAVEHAVAARTAARYQDYVRRVYGVAAGVDMMRFFEECDEGGERG